MSDEVCSVKSSLSFEATLTALEEKIQSMGLTLFSKIEHAQGASQVGLSLNPCTLLIYGNPKAGTPLMQQNMLIGLDLPLKTLVWQDSDQQVWLSYADIDALASKHGLTEHPAVAVLKQVVAKLH